MSKAAKYPIVGAGKQTGQPAGQSGEPDNRASQVAQDSVVLHTRGHSEHTQHGKVSGTVPHLKHFSFYTIFCVKSH